MTTVYHKNFEIAGHHCLEPKGLTLDLWSNSIEDGQKGDFLSLYGLNLLLDTHTLVHLNNNQIWTTIKNPPKSHDDLIAMCNFHLVYLQRGLFVELIERKHPLIVVDETTDTKSIVMGELTSDKCDTLDKVIYRGLGFGVDKSGTSSHTLPCTTGAENTTLITIKDEQTLDTEVTTSSSEELRNLVKKFNLKQFSIKCSRTEVEDYL